MLQLVNIIFLNKQKMQPLYHIEDSVECLVVIDLNLSYDYTLYDYVLGFKAIVFNECDDNYIGLN